jgi:hypothetical protein
MGRRLSCGIGVLLFALAAFARPDASESIRSAAVERFLAIGDPDPHQYRALRRLEARNEHFDREAKMEVWTEGDASGFRYTIVSEEGSEYIRNRVFRQTLEMEKQMWASGAPDRAGLTSANYVFADRGLQPDGLLSVDLKPRRKDVLLVDGAVFFDPANGDLVRMEGRLSKTPSFWTRRVNIVRWFKRFAGIRMPVALDSTANVLVAGRSTFRMSYEYESVNDEHVGSPVTLAQARR